MAILLDMTRAHVPVLAGELIEHADLSGGCVIVGAGDNLEIWNAETWARHEAELDAAAAEIAESLADSGEA